MEITNKYKKGFTLIELLIVVLIIGILAAIALPQYQVAVGKARFTTLKNITKSIQESAQRYYMINGTYDLAAKDLDIDLNIISGGNTHAWFQIRDKIYCYIWIEGQQSSIACGKEIFGNTIRYYVERETGKPLVCLTFSVNKNDNSNKLCQQETGKTAKQASCSSTYCNYLY